ncbi:MAG: TRAP transporter large permease subunit, partial [Mailhella sp.]|nr:TRAP transporter large permease subunit [Mailhella sp.]
EFIVIFLAVLFCAALTYMQFWYKGLGVKLSGLAIGCIGFCLLLFLMLMRFPLGFTMCFIGLLGLFAVMRSPVAVMKAVATIPYTQTATFIMIALPMFMLMGDMVTMAGLSHDIFNAAQKWMGRLPGGLAIAAVGGCAGFGAVCGDSMATAIAMSSVSLPAMRENGYNMSLACGSLAAGGTLGILIPPSMGFIVYSMVTEVSVGKLFISGILPGIVLAAIFCSIIFFQVIRHPDWAPKTGSAPFKEKIAALIGLIPVLILFLVVVIGILRGWFTPAEGGALGAVMAIIYAAIRRQLSWKSFSKTLINCTVMFGKMFALFIGLSVFNVFLATSRLPNLLATTVANLQVSPYVILVCVIILYIFLGCVMNIMPMMILTLPSIFPTIIAIGFDPVWFGCLCVIVMEMGQITPPVGLNVFTLASIASDVPMASIFKGVLPFFCGMLLCVLLVVLFPQLAMYLLD